MTLAILGGNPAISKEPMKYPWFTNFEFEEIRDLIHNSNLSGFLAAQNEQHLGGIKVQKLESEWQSSFGFQHAISFNSWTSGLEAAIASLGLPRNSEVIVPAWTMSASVAAIVQNNLTPHFVDINPNDFNLDPCIIPSAINSRTSAVLGVDIFGKPCDAITLSKICRERNLKFIIDAAQTPKALVGNERSVRYADVGGYSLNRHKHIQIGEGGIAVTNNQLFAERMRLYRNHSEVTSKQLDLAVPIGHNLRLGEIEAALASYQLKNLNTFVEDRRSYGNYLRKHLTNISWLEFSDDSSYLEHDYYILGMTLRINSLPITRERLIDALKAEGLTGIVSNYAQLHKLNSFEKFPRTSMTNTETLYSKTFLGLYLCGFKYEIDDLDRIIECFCKIDKFMNVL